MNVTKPRQVAAVVTASGALVKGKHNPVDATSGARTMTLPTGASEGVVISVEKTDASTNAVTISGSIRGVGGSSRTLVAQSEGLMLMADSTGSWWIQADHKTKTYFDATYVGSTAVRSIVQITAAAYAALATPDSAILYIIVG